MALSEKSEGIGESVTEPPDRAGRSESLTVKPPTPVRRHVPPSGQVRLRQSRLTPGLCEPGQASLPALWGSGLDLLLQVGQYFRALVFSESSVRRIGKRARSGCLGGCQH